MDAEESESWNLGAIWAPTTQFGISVDVWSIEQDNKIDEQDFGSVYNTHCNDQNSTVCVRLPAVNGDALGVIQTVNSTFENVSSQEASGVDLSTNYNLDLNDMGLLKFNLEWSYMHEFTRDDREYIGEYEYPRHRGLFATNWEFDKFNVNMNISYIGSFEDTPDADFDGALDFDMVKTRDVDSQTLVDIQGAYNMNDAVRISVGMNNVFDEEPPFAIGDGDSDLYGYAGSVHNPRGRYVYTNLTWRFN